MEEVYRNIKNIYTINSNKMESTMYGGSRPNLIFIFGPTGSGKTSMRHKIIKQMNLSDYEYLSIDDLVESDKEYKKMINEIFLYKCNNKSCTKDQYQNMPYDIDTIKKINTAYYYVRKIAGCKTNQTKYNCEELLDNKMENLLKQGKNIIIESTGTYYPDWLFDETKFSGAKYVYEHNYFITVTYSFVNLCDLINRNYIRFVHKSEKFIKSNFKSNAPRLPNILDDITNQDLRRKVIKIQEVLMDIIKNKCYERKSNACKGYIDNLIIFDNNKKMKCVFNLIEEDQIDIKNKISEVIKKYFYVSPDECHFG